MIDEAARSHPFLWEDGVHRASPECRGRQEMAQLLDAPLPEPSAPTRELRFASESLRDVRTAVSDDAIRAGLDGVRAAEVALGVHELTVNSVRYGGGGGTVRTWTEAGRFVVEVRDAGCIDEPLVGREQPTTDGTSGRGLWLVNQLCDLVQIRSSAAGTVVRVHQSPAERASS